MKEILKKITIERLLLIAIIILQAIIIKDLENIYYKNSNLENFLFANKNQSNKSSDSIIDSKKTEISSQKRTFSDAQTDMLQNMDAFLESVIGDFRMIDRFMNPPLGWHSFESIPTMDMRETKNSYTIVIAVPEYFRSSVKVSLDGRLLYISGNNCVEQDSFKNYSKLSFTKKIILPEQVKGSDTIETFLTNGLLTINIPKSIQ